MSLANNLLNTYNNLNSGLVEQSDLITQISEALATKVSPTAKEEQEKIINTQAYNDTTVTVEPDEGKTLSKVTVNINVKDEQEKSIEIIENGIIEISPDDGKTLSKVNITTNIEGGVNENNIDFLELKQTLSSYSNGSLIEVDSYAFANCSSLQSINLPMCSTIGSYAFCYCSSLTTINLPVCRWIVERAFASCSSLQSINLPMCNEIGGYAFHDCKSLQSIDLPVCSNINYYTFVNCTSLQYVNLPACKGIAGYQVFSNCTSLSSVNLPICSYINGGSVFYNCTSLITLILKYSSRVVTLNSANVFYNTPMSTSSYTGSFGSIYVPASLVDAYKSATNWTVYADRITAIVE